MAIVKAKAKQIIARRIDFMVSSFERLFGLLIQQYAKYILCQYENELVKIIFLGIIT
jgi:hypothetical protein